MRESDITLVPTRIVVRPIRHGRRWEAQVEWELSDDTHRQPRWYPYSTFYGDYYSGTDKIVRTSRSALKAYDKAKAQLEVWKQDERDQQLAAFLVGEGAVVDQ
jgi:hypothetical protein